MLQDSMKRRLSQPQINQHRSKKLVMDVRMDLIGRSYIVHNTLVLKVT